MSTGTATYLYCLLRRADPPDAEGAPRGVPGASAPRALPVADDLWLIAAEVPLPDYGETEIAARMEDLDWVSDRALAHERTVEHFAGTAEALVPMKLLTLFASPERAVDHVRRDLPRLRPILDRVAGREEWGVRVSYDARGARQAAAAEAEDGASASGKDFLLRKKRMRDAARGAPAAAREAADGVWRELSARADDAILREPVAGQTLLLDAAFLVPRSDHERFEAAVEAAARRLAATHCELTLTGPWPPYNFSGDPSGAPAGGDG